MSIMYRTSNEIMAEKCCYFCRESGENFHKQPAQHSGYSYCCPHSGSYQITRDTIINLHEGYRFRAIAASIAQERKLKGQDNYVLTWQYISGNDDEHQVCANGIPFLNQYPEDYLEKLDRILVNIGRKTGNSPLNSYLPDYHDFGLFYVIPTEDYYVGEQISDNAKGNLNQQIKKTLFLLEEMVWIRFMYPQAKEYDFLSPIFLTVDGLKHLQELRSKIENKKQPFIAMWFASDEKYGELLKKYFECIDAAVNIAGYHSAYVVNKEKYNGLIMNRVINQIKESRFLIADLTCDKKDGMRGGVYYEAGLAEGLGMPVILTCEKEAHNQGLVHFDLKQFNTILWYIDDKGFIRADGHPDEDFSQYVADWIIRTVG